MIVARKSTVIECSACGKSIRVRDDYLGQHLGRCPSCTKVHDWKDEEYREKCSSSHRGNKPGNQLPPGESNFRRLMYSYKQGASVRGVEFLLTEDDFRALTKQDCFYCGAPPAQAYDKGRSHAYNGMWIHNGVDRISDRGGYTTENCVPCCKACNYMKQGMDDTEFFDHIVSIHNHMESQGYECDTLGSRAELAK